MMIKLLRIPEIDPFRSHIFEVKEFPEDKDFFLLESYQLEDFLDEVLNPNGSSPLLGIETDEEGIEYIESCYLAGVQRLKKSEGQ